LKGRNLVGEIIADRYELLSIAGVGGMGTVYKAHQLDLDRPVAIKFLDSDFVSDDEMYSRFQLEARALAQLSHKNVGGFYAFGALKSGEPFIVMEYLEGQSLAAILCFGALPIERVLHIAIQIASGMSSAHKANLVHRDLKPGNILLSSEPEFDTVKVVDFGLAKHVEISSNASYTRTGQLVGTPQYLSPEQCRGVRNIDSRADIYAFGCVLYEMLLGSPPFDADTPVGYVYKHLNEEVAFPSLLSKDERSAALCRGVMHCMEKEPARRYQFMNEVEHDLLCIKEKRLGDLVAPFMVRPLKWRVPAILVFSIAIVVSGLLLTAVLQGNKKRSNSVRVDSRAVLVNEIKQAERDKRFDGEKAQIAQLKELVRSQSQSGDRPREFLLLAQQLQEFPVAANQLAIAAIMEAVGLKTSKWTTVKDDRSKKNFGSSVDVGKLNVRKEEDEETKLNAALVVDAAAQILLKNKYYAERNLIVSLLSANKLHIVQAAHGMTAFHDFVYESAERTHIPLQNLFNLYEQRSGILRRRGLVKEASLVDKKAYFVALKLHGPENAITVRASLAAIDPSNLSEEDLKTMKLALRCARTYGHKRDGGWLSVYEKVCGINMAARRWDAVIADVEESLRLRPKGVFAYVLLQARAQAYLSKGQASEAIADLRKAYRYCRDDYSLRYAILPTLLDALRKNGRKQEAREFLDEQIRKFERHKLFSQAAHLCFMQGRIAVEDSADFRRAQEYFKRGVATARWANDQLGQLENMTWILVTENRMDGKETEYLGQVLELVMKQPNPSIASQDIALLHVLQDTVHRYKKHGFTQALKDSAPGIASIASFATAASSKDSLSSVKELLDAYEQGAQQNPSINKEIQRLRTLAAN
jgi:serine/threonine protein kinase